MKKLLTLLCMLSFLAVSGSAFAEAGYPRKPITLIVPMGAGTVADIVMRTVQPYIEKELGQKVILDYKVGAGGIAGLNQFAAMKPDGYTLVMYNFPHYFLQPKFEKTLYKGEDLEPLMTTTVAAECVFVPVDSPFKTFQDFYDYAKANPGKITVGNTGTYGVNHLTHVIIEKELGIEVTRIPYENAVKSITAMLNGDINAVYASVENYPVFAGKMRAIAVAANERQYQIPEAPTFPELGYPNVINQVAINIFTHAKAPEDVKEVLRTAFDKIAQDPQLREDYISKSFSPGIRGPQGVKELRDAIGVSIEEYYNLFDE